MSNPLHKASTELSSCFACSFPLSAQKDQETSEDHSWGAGLALLRIGARPRKSPSKRAARHLEAVERLSNPYLRLVLGSMLTLLKNMQIPKPGSHMTIAPQSNGARCYCLETTIAQWARGHHGHPACDILTTEFDTGFDEDLWTKARTIFLDGREATWRCPCGDCSLLNVRDCILLNLRQALPAASFRNEQLHWSRQSSRRHVGQTSSHA